MTTKDWAALPSEIIVEILQNLRRPHYNHFQYQMLNKHWFFSSLDLFYGKIEIEEELYLKLEYYEKLEGLYSLLKDPSFNIGSYVKCIDTVLSEEDDDDDDETESESSTTTLEQLFGYLIQYCPNVKDLIFRGPDELYKVRYLVKRQQQRHGDLEEYERCE